MRKTIKLTESELRNLISESVSRILEEMDIDPKNKGKFTATQKRTGKSTEQLCHSKNPLTRKRANFAKMAKRGWKPLDEAFKSNIIKKVTIDILNEEEMLKIPELPIYNTERYTNFSPISPDDIRPGDIYTNDSLFLYVSHFSFNKTAGYSVWDKEGEYVGTDMFSSDNIYAIVTYLNNNNFRPLDYDLEVIDPFNTDRRLLLTPNGIKKVNNVEEKYIRKATI